jgi:hypothetical protein
MCNRTRKELTSMKKVKLLIVASVLVFSMRLSAQVNVWTRSYDNRRSGANTNETILNPTNVASNFGKLHTIKLDGQVYAQPLVISNITVNGKKRNVVYVATMNNAVCAYDADTAAYLWCVRYGIPMVTSEIQDNNHPNIDPTSPTGILSTPVIDVDTNTMYFVHANETKSNGVSTYSFVLEAIDITNGEKVHSPVSIKGTYSTADLKSPLVFNPKVQNQRTSLALANGNVYIAFSSHNDEGVFHGWVFAYSATTLDQIGVYSDTTSGSDGGIWQAGAAPAVDEFGNVFYSTGNGSFGTTSHGLVQTGNSFIKLGPTLDLVNYFTPHDSATMNSGDMDIGASGILLIPDPDNPKVTKYALGGGKSGIMYLTLSNDLGRFNSSKDNIVQEFQAVYGTGTSHIHGTPVYVKTQARGQTIYVWGENDKLRMFTFDADTGLINTTPYAMSKVTAPVTHADGAMPGGFLSVSANNTANQILWASTPYSASAAEKTVQGALYAFDTRTLKVIWSDKTNDARDEVGMFAKDVPPVVANGKMYMATFGPLGTTKATGELLIYGLLK